MCLYAKWKGSRTSQGLDHKVKGAYESNKTNKNVVGMLMIQILYSWLYGYSWFFAAKKTPKEKAKEKPKSTINPGNTKQHPLRNNNPKDLILDIKTSKIVADKIRAHDIKNGIEAGNQVYQNVIRKRQIERDARKREIGLICKNETMQAELNSLRKKKRVTEVICEVNQTVQNLFTIIGDLKKQPVQRNIDHIIEAVEMKNQARTSTVNAYLAYLAEKAERKEIFERFKKDLLKGAHEHIETKKQPSRQNEINLIAAKLAKIQNCEDSEGL
ncbi:uncharacterized protein [Clytia hemisphaerica]|uniref:uncharacterized protein n=1 Tax=Clytia hemisphaerica TaxID=252671 RepID=UPI0034D62AB5